MIALVAPRPPALLSRLLLRRRIAALRWRLRNVESDIAASKLHQQLWEGEAASLRTSLALLGALHA